MNRRGIALLATLWLLAALSVVAASALTLARLEQGSALNRVALTRGRWAAEACLALLQGAAARDTLPEVVDSTDLGDGLWCRARVEDLGARLGATIENADALARLVGGGERAAALLDWLDADDAPREGGGEREWYLANGQRPPCNGPLAAMEELRSIRGFDSAMVAFLTPLLSTRPTRRLNVNVAPAELLRILPGLEPAAADLIVQHRERGARFKDLDGLLATLPASLRAPALARYAELQGSTAFTPEQVEIHLEGHVPESSIVARAMVLGIPVPGRLAVVSREEW
jgi:general secretion pathway protein K